MRMGLQVSADRGRYATKVEKLQADARWADEAGLDSVWTPQIPDEFDVMTAATLIGAATSRIEVGTAIVPLQPRHPIVLAQQALSNQAVCEGRFTLGLGVSHHWIIQDMLGLPYERQVTAMRCTLDVLDQALAGPGMVKVDNELFTIRNPLDITDIAPTPVMIAALGPVMLKLAGERAAGTTLWLADERTIGSHVVPTITKAADAAGRPAPRILAGVPVCLCRDDEIDAAIARTNRTLSEVEASPNYVKLMEHGDAQNIGDVLVCGSEATMEKRLRSFADAGLTDFNARIVPLGEGRDELKASAERTRAVPRRGRALAAGLRFPSDSAGAVGDDAARQEVPQLSGGVLAVRRLFAPADGVGVGGIEHDRRQDDAGHLGVVQAGADVPRLGGLVAALSRGASRGGRRPGRPRSGGRSATGGRTRPSRAWGCSSTRVPWARAGTCGSTRRRSSAAVRGACSGGRVAPPGGPPSRGSPRRRGPAGARACRQSTGRSCAAIGRSGPPPPGR